MAAIDQYTDEELLIRLNAGDRTAFEHIYRTYLPDLYRFAKRNIAVREDCEEIIQEVFESIWMRHKDLKMTSIKFYLLSMVKYKVIRYFKHSSIKRRYAEHFEIFASVYDNINDEAMDEALIQGVIDRRISELPERCQTAFKLRIQESLSNADIATRMNITKKTVEGYIFQAFSHLKTSNLKASKAG